MAHFAELNENNVVLRVIVVNNNELFDGEEFESEQNGIDFCVAHFGGRWVQTSYNGNFRKNYAGEGYLYDPVRDAFIAPQPSSEYQLNEETLRWEEIDPMTPFNWYWRMGASEFFDRNMKEFTGKPNLKFLEIGSAVGTSAIEQIKNVLTGENANITCLDIWENSELETSFDEQTSPYSNKIIKAKSDSKTWLEQNQDKRFDFIYIDGDHSAQGIQSDTALSWPLLKPGGVMALDDVLLNDETELANRKFVESVKNESTIIDDGYQIWLKKNPI
jgi:hypothetical protein